MNIAAYTSPDHMPAYLSVNRTPTRCVEITVRGAATDGALDYGATSTILLSEDEWNSLLLKAWDESGLHR